MPVDWQRLQDGVAGALGVDESMRDEWLSAFCEGDGHLLAEIASLLALGPKTAAFLESPIGSAVKLAEEAHTDWTDRKGRQFGNYRILGELGHGGMGVVFLAERNDGEFEQRVALKIVRQSIADSHMVDRFRRERQILASLDHPNIARLLDGGITEDGEPYLAMEFVDGVTLCDYVERNAPDLGTVLGLFLKICSALAYAHRNLVVHRDIKPSNILVTSAGEPKLLDFGLAKLLDEGLSSDSTQTQTEFRALTPAYASPEQLKNVPPTTTSDIYSLGVVFYELVTGNRPFDFEGRTLDEIVHAVDTQTIALPSAGSELAFDRSDLRGDIDNIALMALQSDPERRYQTVEMFSADIEKHLNGLPVLARPNTLKYRTEKFVKRNKFSILAAAMVLIALLGGLVATFWQARVAAGERDQAKRAQAKAEELNIFLQEILSAASPEEKGKDAKVIEILDDALLDLDTRFAEQEELKAEALLTIGETYNQLDLTDKSEPTLRRALDLNLRLYGAENKSTALSMAYLGQALLDKAKLDEAEGLLTTAIETQRKISPADNKDLAFALHVLGELSVRKKNYEQADTLLQESIAISDRIFGENNPDSAYTLISLGRSRTFAGDLDGAETRYRRSVAIYRQLPPRYSVRLGVSLLNLGQLLVLRKSFEEAIKNIVEADRLLSAQQGESYVTFESKFYLANAYFAKDDLENTIAAGNASIAIGRKLGLEDVPDFAPTLEYVGVALSRTGRAVQGEGLLREAVLITSRQSPVSEVGSALAKGMLGDCLLEQRRFAEAESLLLDRLDVLRHSATPDSAQARSAAMQVFHLYKQWGKPRRAEKFRV